MRKCLTTAMVVAGLFVAARADAQRVAPVSLRKAGNPTDVPQQRPTRTNPTFTLHAGIATGDNQLDVGIMVGGSFGWDIKGLPIDVRFDPSIARYGGGDGNVDLSSILLGIPVAVEYEFATAGKAKPYVMGGVGMYYNRVSVEVNSPGFGISRTDSDTDLGIAFGGGIRFNERFGLEGRVIDVNSFTTLPILLTIRF